MQRLAIYSILFFSFYVQAADLSFGPLFGKNETLQFTLRYDIKKFQAEKANYKEIGIPATISLDEQNMNIAVLSRGKGSFGCQQPQLKLDFKGSNTAGTEFQGFKKIRLFTRGFCMENKTDADNDKAILANYLQYRLLELVTPYHFKTRLVEISYIDESGFYAPYKQLAFFVENNAHLQTRMGLKEIELPNYQNLAPELINKIDPNSESLAVAFEFLLGNFDFGIPGIPSSDSKASSPYIPTFAKNAAVYQDTAGKVYPFIFDFDFSRLSYGSFNGKDICWPSVEMNKIVGRNTKLNPVCKEDEIFAAMQSDLKNLPFKTDAIKNYTVLVTALNQWQLLYQDKVEILGPNYKSNIEQLTRSFKKSAELELSIP